MQMAEEGAANTHTAGHGMHVCNTTSSRAVAAVPAPPHGFLSTIYSHESRTLDYPNISLCAQPSAETPPAHLLACK